LKINNKYLKVEALGMMMMMMGRGAGKKTATARAVNESQRRTGRLPGRLLVLALVLFHFFFYLRVGFLLLFFFGEAVARLGLCGSASVFLWLLMAAVR